MKLAEGVKYFGKYLKGLDFDLHKEGEIDSPLFCAKDPLKGFNPCVYKYWKYEVAITKQGRNQIGNIVEIIDKLYDETTEEVMSEKGCLRIADLVLECLDKEPPQSTAINVSSTNLDAEFLLSKLLELEFPTFLLKDFSAYWSLSEEFTTEVFVCYLKYLVIAALKECKVAPSFWIDQFWHQHITHTKHYRDTCLLVKDIVESEMPHLEIKPKSFVAHLPGDGSPEQTEIVRKLEKQTEIYYLEYFGDDASMNPIIGFQLDYDLQVDPVMSINILGLVVSRYLRIDQNLPSNALKESMQAVREMNINKLDKLKLDKTRKKKLKELVAFDNSTEEEFKRIELRHCSYRPAKLTGFIDKFKNIFTKRKPPPKAPRTYSGWRTNYPIEAFDWYPKLVLKNQSYSFLNELPVFSPKGLITLDFNKKKGDESLSLRSWCLEGFGVDCTLPNFADAIQSSLDLYEYGSIEKAHLYFRNTVEDIWFKD
ncbi:unnamed protein product [Moneuplotes crassus]|uniref:Uncharacterized protein n=1 Tax=Euplotes crassus TaxID=5936 RepID=A0AAD1U7Y3_EUPCR|nr:unnamed protein product [Moneuplotes crassus]